MIEQINIALEQKGSGEFLSLVIKMLLDQRQKREHIHQLKVMKNEPSRVLPSEQDDIKSFNWLSTSAIVAFTTFLTVTDCVLLCHRLNSLND